MPDVSVPRSGFDAKAFAVYLNRHLAAAPSVLVKEYGAGWLVTMEWEYAEAPGVHPESVFVARTGEVLLLPYYTDVDGYFSLEGEKLISKNPYRIIRRPGPWVDSDATW